VSHGGFLLLPVRRYCDFFSGVADELELAPPVEPDAEPEAEPEGCALDEDDESLGCCVVEPAPAEPPLVLEAPEPEGCALELEGALLDEDEEPPLALSFFWMSIEVDDELEPEPEGAALEPEGDDVVPAAELEDEPGAVLGEAVEPAGDVVLLDELAAPGARELLSSPQAVRAAAPNAMETATARVESFMWPPWLGYRKEGARIGPPL